MINPDVVSLVESDAIATPDVLLIDIRDLDVLEDNVLSTVNDAETFALDYALGTLSNEGLVRCNVDTKSTSLVVRNRADGRSVRLVVLAPAVLVDCYLAGLCSTPGRAATGSGGTFEGREVKTVRLYQQGCPTIRSELSVVTYVLVRTMTRGELSPRYETSSSVDVGYTGVALPPPVAPEANPSGVPTTPVTDEAAEARPAIKAVAEAAIPLYFMMMMMMLRWKECEIGKRMNVRIEYDENGIDLPS